MIEFLDGRNQSRPTCNRRVIEVSEGASGKASLESRRDQSGGGRLAEEDATWNLDFLTADLDQRPAQPLPCQEYAWEGWRGG